MRSATMAVTFPLNYGLQNRFKTTGLFFELCSDGQWHGIREVTQYQTYQMRGSGEFFEVPTLKWLETDAGEAVRWTGSRPEVPSFLWPYEV